MEMRFRNQRVEIPPSGFILRQKNGVVVGQVPDAFPGNRSFCVQGCKIADAFLLHFPDQGLIDQSHALGPRESSHLITAGHLQVADQRFEANAPE